MHSLAWLDKWPSEDRRTRIVFIALDWGASDVEELIDAIERLSRRAQSLRLGAQIH